MIKRRINGVKFGNLRRQTFLQWERLTNRKCRLVNDDITGSFECKWQDSATSVGYDHISIFCSLGEWANNISDILKDKSCDNYNFLDNDHRQALYRYYTRILLIISEMLSDFEYIVREIESIDTQKAREFLSSRSSKEEVHSLVGFINNVCKHKMEKLHPSNHHLPIWFEDCRETSTFVRPISVEKLDFDHPDGILIPELSYLVEVILKCYVRLDELFEKKKDKFKLICDKYNGQIIGSETIYIA